MKATSIKYSEWVLELNREDAEEVAERIRSNDEWNLADCEELCRLAGLDEEWAKADGDSFEDVINDAANILGVEIYEVIK